METIKTGIQGFDKLVGGGLPKGRNILLSGTPGTGKTIFALQFLYNGAKQFKEKGLYITFEEDGDSLKRQASQFGWDFTPLEKKGIVKFLNISASQIKEKTAKDILMEVIKGGYSRLVVDSLSALAINTPTTFISVSDITELSMKRFMYRFISDLRLKEATCLLTSQTSDGQLSRDGVSEFLCDGVIHINYESMGGNFSRHLTVRKMREIKNDEDLHPLEIGKKGIVLHDLK